MIGFRLHGSSTVSQAASIHTNPFDAWIQIHPDNRAVLILAKCEMGQGVYTGLPMILAEEAELDWGSITIQQSLQSTGTGGSGSTAGSYLPLRQAGAVVREAMITAAALQWNVPEETCVASQSRVTHPPSGRVLSYGELIPAARRLPLPNSEHVPLKSPANFKLIGRQTPALDIPEKVKGSACFGLDVRLPEMLFAVIARCPTFGGKVAKYDGSKALAIPGVSQVFVIEPRGFRVHSAGGVAVVANSTWAAFQGRKALTVDWDHGPHATESSQQLHTDLLQALQSPGKILRDDGAVDKAFAMAARQVEAMYQLPFQAHATMEPMNSTILLRDGRCEVWCPSQSPDWARTAIAKELGLQESEVTVHTTFMGGGFGRRYIADYPVEAAQIARHVPGPVQLVWSREDDMTHDFYRPASCHQMKAALNHDGSVAAWSHHIASTSIRTYWDPPETVKPESAEIGGAVNHPYPLPAIRVSYAPVASVVPRGWWRSVEHSVNWFAIESFMDELALAAGQDPYTFRKAILSKLPATNTKPEEGTDLRRLMAVLDLAAAKSGWGSALEKGMGRGIACGNAYGYLAQVAEVTVKDGKIQVNRIVTAIDCGQVVNRNGVLQQIEGAVVYGLSAALKGEITIRDGGAQQTNFSEYDLVRMPEAPRMEVHLVENHFDPSGVGEAGVPLVAPSVANAIFAATGKRLRKLPFRLDQAPV